MTFHSKPLFVSGVALFIIAIVVALFTHIDAVFSQTIILSPRDAYLPLVKFISKLGSFAIVTPLSIMLALWLWLKKYCYDAIWVLLTMGSCRIVFSVLKILVGRDRPVFDEPLTHALSYSFPSGHAVNSMMFFLVCCSIFSLKHVRFMLLALLTLLIGWSRLALGAHWLSDVIAGWGCAFMWFAFIYQMKVSLQLQNYFQQHFHIKNNKI